MANNLDVEPMYVDTAATIVPVGTLASVQRIGVRASLAGQTIRVREGSTTGNVVYEFTSNASQMNAQEKVPIRTTKGLVVSEIGAGMVARFYFHHGSP